MRKPPYPNEPPEYRAAREKLLDAEADLRRQTEEVAALRRSLPPGGPVAEDYTFREMGPDGTPRDVRMSELFAPGKNSLFLYGFMFGPKMKAACPLCTSLLDGLNAQAPHLTQRVNLAVSARSPIDRISEFAASRGWSNLRLLSSSENTYQSDYFAEDEEDNQWPMANVFVLRDGVVRHFWGSELFFRGMEGGDTRHVDSVWPLWNVFDLIPEGRGTDWYPALAYDEE